jgi:hypothetical protein
MRRILKRLEALERAADREIFADAFSFAIAYHLGGARDLSEVMRAYAKALGYEDLHEFVRASAYLFRQESATLKERAAHEARIHQAQCELLAKFGYDVRRASPAALADARYRIVKTLPDKWLAKIKSEHREDCEDEARTTQFLKVWMQVAEEHQHGRRTRRRRWGDPRRRRGTEHGEASNG